MEKRSSNFEMLRIISMFMIVCHHFAIYSGWEVGDGFSLRKLFIDYFGMFGKLGVVIFVLISAYFLCEKEFKWQRVTSIYFSVISYTLFFFFILLFFINKDILNFSRELVTFDYLRTFLPITFRTYWFVSPFIFMIVMSPYLNILINKLSNRDLGKVLIILTVFLSIMPTMIGVADHAFNGGDAMLFFSYLYLLGAFLKRNQAKFTKKWAYLLIFILFSVVLMISILIIDLINPNLEWIFPPYLFAEMNSPLILGMAISLFLFVKNVQMPFNPVVNKLASATFGVYLIHENFFVRRFLWLNLVQAKTFYSSNMLIVKAIIASLVVYLMCTSIELVRQVIVKQLGRVISKRRAPVEPS